MGRKRYGFEFDLSTVRNCGTMVCQQCDAECVKLHGKQKWCGQCATAKKREADRLYSERNREVKRANARLWRLNNPGRQEATKRTFREKNPELVKAREVTRSKREGERRRAAAKKWYADNREKVLARGKSDEGRARARERQRRKRTDPTYRVYVNLSRHIRASVADKRRRSWERIVGYTLDQLAEHLERQFTTGMDWSNYGHGEGSWQIDHIVPRVAFHFTSAGDPQFKACWALTNLRPLWWRENIEKHGNRLHLF